jgi:hypothetical protein
MKSRQAVRNVPVTQTPPPPADSFRSTLFAVRRSSCLENCRWGVFFFHYRCSEAGPSFSGNPPIGAIKSGGYRGKNVFRPKFFGHWPIELLLHRFALRTILSSIEESLRRETSASLRLKSGTWTALNQAPALINGIGVRTEAMKDYDCMALLTEKRKSVRRETEKKYLHLAQ